MIAPFDTLLAILFDLDGTLIETHIDFPAMIQEMRARASRAGVPPCMIEGKDILAIVESASLYLTASGEDGKGFRQAAFRKLEEMEVRGCATPVLLLAADHLLTYLFASEVKVGIVTRNCRAVASSLLDRYCLPYHLLLTRDDVSRTKPHPEHLWQALHILECHPAEAAMVGDHPMDIQAGNAAGCAVTVGITGRHTEDWFQACPPAYLVNDLSALLELFRSEEPQV